MKILMVNKFLFPKGGSETYIFKLAEQLNKLGHQVEFFGMEHEGNIVTNSANVYTKDMDFHTASALKKISYSLKTIYSTDAKHKMKLVLENFNPDIVHLNNFNFQLTPTVIEAVREYEKKNNVKVKIVYTAHDYQLVCPNHMMMYGNKVCEECIFGNFKSCIKHSCIHNSKLKSTIGAIEGIYWHMKHIYKDIDVIVCPSKFIESKISANSDLKNKTVVLHNFIEKQEQKEIEKEDYILYFGRFDKGKGVETLTKSKYSFICAGSGPLEDIINNADNTKNIGFKTGSELEMLVRKAKCSVYPSIWYENCPFSILESIMLGTPVVGANIGGVPELIDEGVTGFLFKPGDANDMDKKIEMITNEMSSNCFKNNFDDVETYTIKLLKVYGE